MPTDAEILTRKQAREIAEEIAALALGEAKDMTAQTQAVFYQTLAARLPLPPAKPSPAAGIEPFSDHQARQWGKTRIKFGMYADTPIDEIPLSYLEKLIEPNDFVRHLRRYLASTRIAMEEEAAEQRQGATD